MSFQAWSTQTHDALAAEMCSTDCEKRDSFVKGGGIGRLGFGQISRLIDRRIWGQFQRKLQRILESVSAWAPKQFGRLTPSVRLTQPCSPRPTADSRRSPYPMQRRGQSSSARCPALLTIFLSKSGGQRPIHYSGRFNLRGETDLNRMSLVLIEAGFT